MTATALIDANRAVVGIAVSFGPSRSGWDYQPEQFDRWLALEMGLGMRIDHGPVIDHRGAIRYVGRWVAFAEVRTPVHGLLCLGEIADDESTRGFGSQLLHDLKLIMHQQVLPRDYWGLSIACHLDEETQSVLPFEVSLTRDPACPDAAILGVGPEAVDRWHLLTEAAPKAA
jgi:hypothetical protein